MHENAFFRLPRSLVGWGWQGEGVGNDEVAREEDRGAREVMTRGADAYDVRSDQTCYKTFYP